MEIQQNINKSTLACRLKKLLFFGLIYFCSTYIFLEWTYRFQNQKKEKPHMNFLLLLTVLIGWLPLLCDESAFSTCTAGKQLWVSEPHRSGSDTSCAPWCCDFELGPEATLRLPCSCSEGQTCNVVTRVLGTINPQWFFIIITVVTVWRPFLQREICQRS